MSSELVLLPAPRHIEVEHNSFSPQSGKFIQIGTPHPQQLLFSGKYLKDVVEKQFQCRWALTASQSIDDKSIAVHLCLDSDRIKHPQGYCLTITPEKINICAAQAVGIYYGVQTLIQIINQAEHNKILCAEILDWPDFLVRGVLLDISRDKVYRMETLFMLIEELSNWKINQLQLYIEHSFAYQGHQTVWENASPITPEDILELDRYCKTRFIELVPNQNSFGHMSRWLKLPAYQHLAETTQPVETPWGQIQTEPFSLAPTQPETLEFVSRLYDQLLPNFSSKMVNVGCDETFDIGLGKSKAACEKKGKAQVYLDYLLSLYHDLSHRGYTMQFWGDIVLQFPDLVSQLPEDIIALNWGYEADHPFGVEAATFQENHVPFYVCPGTSSWNSLAGRLDNMRQNCLRAAEEGLNYEAAGFLLTDWGDNGHWQQLPISYPGFAAGAAFSWCLDANRDINLSEILDIIVLKDHSKQAGDLMISIGNEYQSWGIQMVNSSPLFWFLQESKEKLRDSALIDPNRVSQSLSRLENQLKYLSEIDLDRTDAELIRKELKLTIRLMQLACQRCLSILDTKKSTNYKMRLCEFSELIADFRDLWLARNRIGGLSNSISHFDSLLKSYVSHHA